MRTSSRVVVLRCGSAAVLAVVMLAPTCAAADAHACADGPTPRWISRTTLGVSIVPFGAEVQARAAACFPLFPRDGDWFDLAMIEIGAATAISPVYVAGGGYATLTPNNLVSFRLEALGVGYWTLPLEGAGYYALPAADTPRDPETTLAVEHGRSAGGFTLRALTTFQVNIPAGPLAILVWNTAMAEHTEIGAGPYFVNLQVDHTQRRDDLVFGNDAVFVLEVPASITAGPSVRLGAYDSFRHVLATRSEGHQVGGIAVVGWSHPIAEIAWMEIGLRGGGFTHHPVRSGELTIAAWAMVEWDLGAI